MKRYTAFALVLVFAALTAIPCFSRNFGFSPPMEGGFFPIGWSNDNSLFAYGWFEPKSSCQKILLPTK